MKKIYTFIYLFLFLYFTSSFVFYKKDFYAFLVAFISFLFFADSLIKNTPNIIGYIPKPILFIIASFYIIFNWIGAIIGLITFSIFMLEIYYIKTILTECSGIYRLYRIRLAKELNKRDRKYYNTENHNAND